MLDKNKIQKSTTSGKTSDLLIKIGKGKKQLKPMWISYLSTTTLSIDQAKELFFNQISERYSVQMKIGMKQKKIGDFRSDTV